MPDTNPVIVLPNRCHRCGRLTERERFCGPCMAEIEADASRPPHPAIAPGWQCPCCLTVYPPSVRMCECCKPPVATITFSATHTDDAGKPPFAD